MNTNFDKTIAKTGFRTSISNMLRRFIGPKSPKPLSPKQMEEAKRLQDAFDKLGETLEKPMEKVKVIEVIGVDELYVENQLVGKKDPYGRILTQDNQLYGIMSGPGIFKAEYIRDLDEGEDFDNSKEPVIETYKKEGKEHLAEIKKIETSEEFENLEDESIVQKYIFERVVDGKIYKLEEFAYLNPYGSLHDIFTGKQIGAVTYLTREVEYPKEK